MAERCVIQAARRRRVVAAVALLLLAAARLSAETIPEMEFRDEPVSTILLVLGHAVGKTVLADATVTGTASYYFRNRSFQDALAAFASSQDLHIEEREGTIHVSRIRLQAQPDGRLSVEARDVPLHTLVQAVDEATAVPVTQSGMAGRRASIHAESLTLPELLDALVAALPAVEVRAAGAGYVVRSVSAAEQHRGMNGGEGEEVLDIHEEDGAYDLRVRNADLLSVLRELFAGSRTDYLNLMGGTPRVGELRLSGVSLNEAVEALTLAAGVQAVRSGGRWVLIDRSRGAGGASAAALLATTVLLHLEHADAQTTYDALPPEIAQGLTVSVVAPQNALRVTGSAVALRPILEFVRLVDRAPAGVSYHRYELVYADAQEMLQSLPRELTRNGALIIEETNTILLPLTQAQSRRVTELIAAADRAPAAVPMRLNHRSVEELIDSLPASVPRRYIHPTAEPGLFLFTGPPAVEPRLRELIRMIDVEAPQIRYDLFIVQYQEGKSVDYRLALESFQLEPMDTALILGRLGDLLSISADIVSLFGHRFALSLSSALSNNEAQVLADTSVTAVSGTPVSFRNTETYRYRDLPTDTEEEGGRVGVTREITSGLFIDIDGAVTETGEIALAIAATVSKRGHDVSDGAGNPPATSERVVSSSLRAESGEPVVVGSFLLRDRTKSVRKVPLLGDIPILGWLFRGVRSSMEESELVVYLVPHVLERQEPPSPEELIEGMAEGTRE